jgi:hypothetical protein
MISSRGRVPARGLATERQVVRGSVPLPMTPGFEHSRHFQNAVDISRAGPIFFKAQAGPLLKASGYGVVGVIGQLRYLANLDGNRVMRSAEC